MPVRDTPWPPGTPCWVDLAVPDLPAVIATTAFYAQVLGWSFVDTDERSGHYHLARVDGRAVAGIGTADRPRAWTVYLAAEDVDATAALITEHGGTLVSPPADVPAGGRAALALDPTGGPFGIRRASAPIGFEVVDEPGAVTWTDARVAD